MKFIHTVKIKFIARLELFPFCFCFCIILFIYFKIFFLFTSMYILIYLITDQYLFKWLNISMSLDKTEWINGDEIEGLSSCRKEEREPKNSFLGASIVEYLSRLIIL